MPLEWDFSSTKREMKTSVAKAPLTNSPGAGAESRDFTFGSPSVFHWPLRCTPVHASSGWWRPDRIFSLVTESSPWLRIEQKKGKPHLIFLTCTLTALVKPMSLEAKLVSTSKGCATGLVLGGVLPL